MEQHPPQNSERSQFALLKSRRFLPFFLTQFSGALNDNLFKNALLVLLVSGGLAVGHVDTNTLVNLAAGLFILPFFLFSALAGQFADKYEKSAIIRKVKLAEIVIMLVACAALWWQLPWLLLAVLFAMGAQSAFFGPVKYAIIPQHLDETELVGGNAQVESGTFIAILLGTIGGSMLGGLTDPRALIGGTVIGVALLGWLCSRAIPRAESKAARLKIDWNVARESWALMKMASERKDVLLSILGISWFWLIGASYLTQIPNFVVSVLHGESQLIALVLSAFIVGVAGGSLLCERLSGHKVELGLVPFGSLGLSIFGIDLFFAAQAYQFVATEELAGPLSFVLRAEGVRVLMDLALIGMFGSFYIVPLYALIQLRTAPQKRARVIASNNIMNALFMVLASVFGILFLGLAGFSIPEFYLVIAVMNIAVAAFIYAQVPEFAARFLVWLLTHTLYRVRHAGLEHIPEKGGALIVSNHVSYVDALLIGGEVRRPIRFIMYKPIFDIPVLNFIFRVGGAIPICSRSEDEQVYNAAMDSIAESLARGDLLAIFPEGQLTRDGEMSEFKAGIERIVQRTPVPVVPIALRGLWGSFFSHCRPGAFKNPLRRFRSRVTVVAGAPIEPEKVSAARLYDVVLALRGAAQ